MDRQFLRFPDFKKKALTLSYDDGVRQDKRLVSIMEKNGLKGTFNLNSGLFDKEDNYKPGLENGRMSEKEVFELFSNSEMEVAVHGCEHFSLPQVDSAIALNDVLEDRRNLEKLFKKIIKGMAYAYGTFDDKTVELLKDCGIKYCRTVISTEKFDLPKDWLKLETTCHHNNPRLMELAERFLQLPNGRNFWYDGPALFYLWGHSYEFDNDDNWQVIENFAKYIGNRDDVWYATNMEIYNYISAYDSLEFSADGSMIYNPSFLDIYVEYIGNRTIIKSGQIIKTKRLSQK